MPSAGRRRESCSPTTGRQSIIFFESLVVILSFFCFFLRDKSNVFRLWMPFFLCTVVPLFLTKLIGVFQLFSNHQARQIQCRHSDTRLDDDLLSFHDLLMIFPARSATEPGKAAEAPVLCSLGAVASTVTIAS